MMFTSVIVLFCSFLIFSTSSFTIVLPNLIYASAYQVLSLFPPLTKMFFALSSVCVRVGSHMVFVWIHCKEKCSTSFPQ